MYHKKQADCGYDRIIGLTLIWPIQNDAKNLKKKTETLAYIYSSEYSYGYSSESTQRELSNEYQHDRVF